MNPRALLRRDYAMRCDAGELDLGFIALTQIPPIPQTKVRVSSRRATVFTTRTYYEEEAPRSGSIKKSIN